MSQSYIYLVTDQRNGMKYIGQHNGSWKYYFTGSVIIFNILKKHGQKEGRVFLKKEIITQGNFNHPLLDELEKHYIRLYATKWPHGYNLTDGGHEDWHHTPERNKLVSEKAKARGIPDYQKYARMRGLAKARAADPEFQKRIIVKIQETVRRKKQNGWVRRGFAHSQETRDKISKTLSGRLSPKKGIPMKEAQKQKLREAWARNREARIKALTGVLRKPRSKNKKQKI